MSLYLAWKARILRWFLHFAMAYKVGSSIFCTIGWKFEQWEILTFCTSFEKKAVQYFHSLHFSFEMFNTSSLHFGFEMFLCCVYTILFSRILFFKNLFRSFDIFITSMERSYVITYILLPVAIFLFFRRTCLFKTFILIIVCRNTWLGNTRR